jgi:predicted kinase
MIEVLCGMIASGKSTYARSRADKGALVISHDDLAEMLHCQYRYEPVLRDAYRAMMIHIAHVGIMAGRDVIVDRTHLTRESRAVWIDAARTWQVGIIAIEFPIYAADLHAQRRFEADSRGRPLSDWQQVARHHLQQALAEPLDLAEGFDGIFTGTGLIPVKCSRQLIG